MASYVSKTGVWDITAGATKLPNISIDNLQADSLIKVTCQFYGRSMSDNLVDGYSYRIKEGAVNLITLTPDIGFVQGSDSWQLYTHIVLFQVPSAADGKETSIDVSIEKGDMNGIGAMMNYVLLAEVIN